MEAVTLLGLMGLGYAVSKLKRPGSKEGFEWNGVPHSPRGTEISSQRGQIQDTAVARGPPQSALALSPTGASARGRAPELDQMYRTPDGNLYASEPNPGPYGDAFGYSTKSPGLVPKGRAPAPVPIEDSTPQVQLNPAGIEADPNYAGGDYVVSPLTGEKIPSGEYRHNNMVPFFGGRVKQNMRATANTDRLDSFTGSGVNQIKKQEVENMFKDAQAPFGNPFGLESSTDFMQSRIDEPRNRAGERPFEPTRVGPAINEKFGQTGKGGFQQFEVNQYMQDNIRTTDQRRTANKPKLTYEGVTVPGQHFIGKSAEVKDIGEVRKNRPDRFYIDDTGVTYGAVPTATDTFKEAARPVQILPHTVRPETSVEYTPSAASQDYGQSYVTGSFRTPMTQQHGGPGYRNADMTEYFTNDVDAPKADYGRSGFENRPNERDSTSERTMGLNAAPSMDGQGATTIHFDDDARPTRRGETIGNIRQTGTPVGYAGSGAPAITVWDPSDIARTTVKESTVEWNMFGIASPGAAPARLTVYDPDDIARPTQKSQLSSRSYIGAPMSATQASIDEQFAYNMRTNSSKEQIAARRPPKAGNGNIQVFTGEYNQKSKKINADYINDRANTINRVVGFPTGVGDIGLVKYRAPLHLDVSAERLTPDIVSSVENNPLNQSLRKNAILDEQALKKYHQMPTAAVYA